MSCCDPCYFSIGYRTIQKPSHIRMLHLQLQQNRSYQRWRDKNGDQVRKRNEASQPVLAVIKGNELQHSQVHSAHMYHSSISSACFVTHYCRLISLLEISNPCTLEWQQFCLTCVYVWLCVYVHQMHPQVLHLLFWGAL